VPLGPYFSKSPSVKYSKMGLEYCTVCHLALKARSALGGLPPQTNTVSVPPYCGSPVVGCVPSVASVVPPAYRGNAKTRKAATNKKLKPVHLILPFILFFLHFRFLVFERSSTAFERLITSYCDVMCPLVVTGPPKLVTAIGSLNICEIITQMLFFCQVPTDIFCGFF
jgi:hypothetical protein